MSTNSLQPSHVMTLFIHKHITSQTIRTHNLASKILNHASFGQSYQLTYNFQINHIIHVNIFYTHILTSTRHHQSSNDLHYTLGLIVTPCPQIAYNQAMQWSCSYTNTSQAKPLEHTIWLPKFETMHNTHASFRQSYQLTYNFQINHTIHVNILYTHILTSTSHHQSVNDLHYTLGLIGTPCPQIAYNQAMQ